jgi:hypothetical protein
MATREQSQQQPESDAERQQILQQAQGLGLTVNPDASPDELRGEIERAQQEQQPNA